ncbi:MAG: hypothetical protein U0984_18045 [Prosthecobacter sp.]|nr:hypothetical protein [Prosthecobacter sp.]
MRRLSYFCKRLTRHWRWFATALLIFAAWFFIPRQASMTQFDPERMGQLESDMWRHYYEKNYPLLGSDLFLASYGQSGFSPWDSTRMAWYAANAARAAQPTQPRAQAFTHALPLLIKYYQVIQKATRSSWQPEEIAPLELEWWVQRREDKSWQQYGEAITQLTAMNYQVPAARVRPACLLRAELMDYRDQRRGRMQEADWQHITSELSKSYQMLKTSVTSSSADSDPPPAIP